MAGIVDLGPGLASAATTTRADGDFHIRTPAAQLDARRRAVVDLPWVWLRQVHGARVVTVTRETAPRVAGSEADAVVTAEAGLVLAVHTADCVPVVFAAPGGVIGACHAGWRGIEAGVVEATVDAMRALGAGSVHGFVGPAIGPECYEFGAAELDRLVDRYGPEVRGETRAGTPALRVVDAVLAAGARAGVGAWQVDRACTACEADRFWSFRARGEAGRMATVVWREVPA